MGKECEISTDIFITGKNAQKYLDANGALEFAPSRDDMYHIGSISSGSTCHTLVGTLEVKHSLVKREFHTNRMVTLQGLPFKPGGKGLSISVREDDGVGRNELKKGVSVVVMTNAPVSVFEKNII